MTLSGVLWIDRWMEREKDCACIKYTEFLWSQKTWKWVVDNFKQCNVIIYLNQSFYKCCMFDNVYIFCTRIVNELLQIY